MCAVRTQANLALELPEHTYNTQAAALTARAFAKGSVVREKKIFLKEIKTRKCCLARQRLYADECCDVC
jgi:hypothetical protein